MSTLLAVDAGGTSTRALLLDDHGAVLGFGRAGGGNPTSRGILGAVEAVAEAAAGAAEQTEVGVSGVATIAMAGQQTPAFAEPLSRRLAQLGWTEVVLQHDLLAAFCSGTWRPDGYALIAGTGSVAARVRDGALERVVGGRGWLLGDAGSGFWIGRRVARAVIADLDGQDPATALTGLALDAAEIERPSERGADRLDALRRLMAVWYAQQPVQLAALAPLPFAVPADPTARRILVDASRALADLVAAVGSPEHPGPVVVAGSVVVHGLLAASPDLRADLAPIGADHQLIAVSDGVLGAAVLALRHAGVVVDGPAFDRLSAEVAAIRR